MTKRIVFVGAAGCGKSTLATQVFSYLKTHNINAELVDEFIRRDIQLNGPMKSIWEQYRTRFRQKELEDAVPNTVDYIICDSGTISPYFYASLYANPLEERQRLVLQDMYRYFIDDLFLKRYDYIFYLPILWQNRKDILEDGTRYQTKDEIKILDDHMQLMFLRLFNSKFVYNIDVSYEKRFDEVIKILKV